jgi:hypothetical protein
LPPELALIGRIVDRLGPRVRFIGGRVQWVVDGASWCLDLDVDGGRWLQDDAAGAVNADTTVEGTAQGIRALFGSAEDLRIARLAGAIRATGDLPRLKAVGAALREGGSFLTHLVRRNAK